MEKDLELAEARDNLLSSMAMLMVLVGQMTEPLHLGGGVSFPISVTSNGFVRRRELQGLEKRLR